jgi:hypothetical protein
MSRLGSLLCAIAAALAVWLAIALFLGPSDGSWMPSMPRDAMIAIAAIAALLGAIGTALRNGPAPVALLLLGAAAPLANTRLMGSQDTVPTAQLLFSIVRERSLTLPGPASDVVPIGEGKFASKYPVATALLALPVALPAAAGHARIGEGLLSVVEKLSASVLNGTMVALLYVALQRLAGRRAALIAAGLTLFGTPALPVLGQALWQHTGAALALAAGLASLGLPDDRRRSILVGLCAGVVIACRPVDAPLALGLLWLCRRRAAAIGLAVPMLLMLLYQRAMFGAFWRTGYGAEATMGWRPPWPDGAMGFAGLWLSPARGLLAIYPLVLFGLWGLWRQRELRPLLAAVIFEAGLMGCWWAWAGGWSPGPRMLAEATPFFGLGIAVAVRESAEWRRPARAALIAAAAVSCGAAMVLTYVVPRHEAHALVRELRDGPWTPRSYPLFAYLFSTRSQ